MKTHTITFLIVLLAFCQIGCNKLIDVGPPRTSVSGSDAFAYDTSALAAVSGIYSNMMGFNPGLLNGALSIYAGLSADELQPNTSSNANQEFYLNTISPSSSNNQNYLWVKPYTVIYQANACIEGIERSNKLSDNVADQLLGEALFLRAFAYFQLFQLYGDVPLAISTNYEENAVLKRTPTSSVIKQIKDDLLRATGLLLDNYPSANRVRVNKWAAKALLAKLYLYMGDWIDAESASDQVINAGMYSLESDLANVFLYSSKEAILQFMPVETGYNTVEGANYVPNPNGMSLPQYSLTNSLLSSFETGDKRLTNWVGTKTVNGKVYTFPYKYKLRINFNNPYPINEYTMVLRLGEQYLIRAEARARLENLSGAINDVDSIRKRAGLPLISSVNPGIDLPGIMEVIQKERQIELFAEWGNRWFDLKRTNQAVIILGSKPQWQATDTLYPIPADELQANPNLIQNPGYN